MMDMNRTVPLLGIGLLSAFFPICLYLIDAAPLHKVLALLLSVLAAYKLVLDHNQGKETTKYNKSFTIPGPVGLPIVGYLPFINLLKLYETFRDISKKFGDVFSIRIGSKLVIVCNDHDSIKEAYAKHEFSGRSMVHPVIGYRKGNHGISMCSGSYWITQRQMVLRHYSLAGGNKSSVLENIITDAAIKAVEILGEDADSGKPVRISPKINVLVGKPVWLAMTGMELDVNDTSLVHAVSRGTVGMSEVIFLSAVNTFFPWISIIGLDKLLLKLIGKNFKITSNKLLELSKEAVSYNRGRVEENFVTSYMEECSTKPELSSGSNNMDEWQLQVILTDILAGSIEMTSSVIHWTILLVASHPQYQAKVHEEIDRVVGQGRLPSLSDRINMPYTEAVVNEGMRFGSFFPIGLVHRSTEDTTFRGSFVPKGTFIISNLYASQRDERRWKDPDHFNPDNFLTNEGKFTGYSPEGHLPFSTGKRVCFGQSAARMEIFLFMSILLQKFSFRIPPESKVTFDPTWNTSIIRGCPRFKAIIETRNT